MHEAVPEGLNVLRLPLKLTARRRKVLHARGGHPGSTPGCVLGKELRVLAQEVHLPGGNVIELSRLDLDLQGLGRLPGIDPDGEPRWVLPGIVVAEPLYPVVPGVDPLDLSSR